MDTRALHDHAWDYLVSTTAAPGAALETITADLPQGEARSGFQVLSLEQYAAGHARSLHEPHDS